MNGSSHAGLSRRYMTFLWHAFNDKTGRFRNFLTYDRTWLEESGSEDSHGRALWSVGTVLGNTKDAGLRGAAGRLFEKAFPAASSFTSPRAWAFSIPVSYTHLTMGYQRHFGRGEGRSDSVFARGCDVHAGTGREGETGPRYPR